MDQSNSEQLSMSRGLEQETAKQLTVPAEAGNAKDEAIGSSRPHDLCCLGRSSSQARFTLRTLRIIDHESF